MLAVTTAVTLPFVLGGGGGSDPSVASTASNSPSALPDLLCPPTGTASATSGPGTVSGDVVAVRLCNGGEGVAFQPPAEPLVTGADELAALVDSQPPQQDDVGCTLELSTSYLLAFQYADGTVRTVVGENYGCEVLRVGGRVLSHAEDVFVRTLDLYRTQRASETAPGSDTRANCFDADLSAGRVSPLGVPDELTSASLCVYPSKSGPPVRERVDKDDLAILLADRNARESSAVPFTGACPSHRNWSLVGATDWGDIVLPSAYCGMWIDNAGHAWAPGPEAQAIIDRLVARSGVTD